MIHVKISFDFEHKELETLYYSPISDYTNKPITKLEDNIREKLIHELIEKFPWIESASISIKFELKGVNLSKEKIMYKCKSCGSKFRYRFNMFLGEIICSECLWYFADFV